MRKLMLLGIGFSMCILNIASGYPVWLLLLLNVVVVSGIFWDTGFSAWEMVLCYIITGVVCALSYFLLYYQGFYAPLREYHGEEQEISAVVVSFPDWGSYSYSVEVAVEFPEHTVKTLLYMDSQAGGLLPGDRISTTAKLYTAEETFSGEKITYYTAKGILLRGVSSGDLEIEQAEGISLSHLPTYLAYWLREGIFSVFPSRYAGVIQALVTGNGENLSLEFDTALERVGLSHTIAVSGMHLAFLAGLLRMLLPKGRKLSSLAIIVLMILFMLVSGSTPSIMRATVMIVMLELAPLFGRERDDGTALSVAVMVILLENPLSVNHVGLHLSLLSVMGIMMFSQKIQTYFTEHFHYDWEFARFTPLKFVISSCSTTFAAMIFTTPLVAYYFGTLSLVAPISNLLALSAVSFVFGGGLLASLMSWSFLGTVISFPLLPVIEYLYWVIPFLSRNPLSAVTMDSFYYRAFLVFVYVLLGIWLIIPDKKDLYSLVFTAYLGFLLCFFLHKWSYFQGDLSMEVFDVGQGQSILFQVEDTLILSDCGGNSRDNAGNIAADAIQSMGKGKLELLVLSHFHADHANGVLPLMERVFIETIAMPVLSEEDPVQEEIIQKALEYGTELWMIEEESVLPLSEGKEIRLFPALGTGDANEEGLTLLITVGETDVLLTGDMGSDIEEILVDTYALPDVEVFVVGHHGSKFSSSEVFLDAITAEIAIISVSGSNSYGHPTEEVLDKLEARNIQVYRTDLQGDMKFSLTG